MSFEAKVVGIPVSVDEDALHDFFARFGELADIRRAADDVFITFESSEDLQDALQVTEFEDGVKITVTRVEAAPTTTAPAAADEQSATAATEETTTEAVAQSEETTPEPVTLATMEARQGKDAQKLRVSELPSEDVGAQLREMFGKCGELVDFFYRQEKGFAFVGFNNNESVLEALKLNGCDVGGKPIKVELKRLPGDRKDPRAAREAAPARNLDRRIVVKKVGSAGESQIRDAFTSCGAITDFFLNRRADVCFLEFATKEGFEAALQLSGKEVDGHAVVVEAREAQRCFQCNQTGHVAAKCPKREIVCHECNRPGHMARDCPSRRGGRSRSDRDRSDRHRRRRSRSRSDSRDRSDRHRSSRRSRRDSSEESRDRRRSRRDRSRSRSRSPARKSRRRDRSRTPPRASK